ncbi:MAG: TetR/AcrR family transcriptional regulator [Phycisphaerae bacterium]|nr:TetR/AcrR family transcriptional regulator [Phycisphaerae bacterium]
MARTSQIREKRRELLPVVARAFTDLGYRRATTAQLARRCGVQQNILYRLWPDKKAMFLAAIEYVYDFAEQRWLKLLAGDGRDNGATRLLRFESIHHGEFGQYRILFAGLAETDDPEIRDCLRRVYRRFHRFIEAQIASHRNRRGRRGTLAADLTSWGVIGLGTAINIAKELDLMDQPERSRALRDVGTALINLQGK